MYKDQRMIDPSVPTKLKDANPVHSCIKDQTGVGTEELENGWTK